ncbi:hypothetical protein BGZ65_009991 [Modicella reniformis]|uniref:Uncharacterized protein n=1 Tax=Modicella reniformis TaxID=1440133 RepID=A0A9P6IUA5_9FUNG|nr:hypothetical protein BGZ65_009991 [Modicella reniformis]
MEGVIRNFNSGGNEYNKIEHTARETCGVGIKVAVDPIKVLQRGVEGKWSEVRLNEVGVNEVEAKVNEVEVNEKNDVEVKESEDDVEDQDPESDHYHHLRLYCGHRFQENGNEKLMSVCDFGQQRIWENEDGHHGGSPIDDVQNHQRGEGTVGEVIDDVEGNEDDEVVIWIGHRERRHDHISKKNLACF